MSPNCYSLDGVVFVSFWETRHNRCPPGGEEESLTNGEIKERAGMRRQGPSRSQGVLVSALIYSITVNSSKEKEKRGNRDYTLHRHHDFQSLDQQRDTQRKEKVVIGGNSKKNCVSSLSRQTTLVEYYEDK